MHYPDIPLYSEAVRDDTYEYRYVILTQVISSCHHKSIQIIAGIDPESTSTFIPKVSEE